MANIYIHQANTQIRQLKTRDLLYLIDLIRDDVRHLQDDNIDSTEESRIIDVLESVIND